MASPGAMPLPRWKVLRYAKRLHRYRHWRASENVPHFRTLELGRSCEAGRFQQDEPLANRDWPHDARGGYAVQNQCSFAGVDGLACEGRVMRYIVVEHNPENHDKPHIYVFSSLATVRKFEHKSPNECRIFSFGSSMNPFEVAALTEEEWFGATS